MSDTRRPDSISIGSEPEFGFAPSIELAGKRGGSSPKMPGKPEFGFAPEIELSAKRDKPPARTPYGRSNHAAQSNAHVLPYEAAMLAASASLARKVCPNGKLVPVCPAAIVATVSVVSGAVVWSAHDDAEVSLKPDISTANSDSPETSLLYGNIQRVAQAPKVDILAAAPQTMAPAD